MIYTLAAPPGVVVAGQRGLKGRGKGADGRVLAVTWLCTADRGVCLSLLPVACRLSDVRTQMSTIFSGRLRQQGACGG